MQATISYTLSDNTVLSIQSGRNPTLKECMDRLQEAVYELEKSVVPARTINRFTTLGECL